MITVWGIEYESIEDFCIKNNIDVESVRIKLEQGISLDVAILKTDRTNKIPVVIDGVIYESRVKACKDYNIAASTVTTRILRGWGVIEAITTPVKSKSNSGFIAFNNSYDNFTVACQRFNLSPNTVKIRMDAGETFEEAVSYLRNVKSGRVELDDKKYDSIHRICSDNDIAQTTVSDRINRGITLDKAIKSGHNRIVGNGVTYEGIWYTSITELCRRNNLDEKLVLRRLRDGLSLKEAIELKRNIRYRDVEVFGKKFSNGVQLCEYFGININTFNYQMRKGKTPEDIVRTLATKNLQ